MEPTVYYVWGGVFRSTEQAWAEPPQVSDLEGFSLDAASDIAHLELHGPFATEAEADTAWLGSTRRHVDICAHRLIVEAVPASAALSWARWKLQQALLLSGIHAATGYGGVDGDRCIEVRIQDDTPPSAVPELWGGFAVRTLALGIPVAG